MGETKRNTCDKGGCGGAARQCARWENRGRETSEPSSPSRNPPPTPPATPPDHGDDEDDIGVGLPDLDLPGSRSASSRFKKSASRQTRGKEELEDDGCDLPPFDMSGAFDGLFHEEGASDNDEADARPEDSTE